MNNIPDRANTPEEKQEIMERLYKLWLKHPELRLGQLIVNIYRSSNSLYLAEDFNFIKELEEIYEQRSQVSRQGWG